MKSKEALQSPFYENIYGWIFKWEWVGGWVTWSDVLSRSPLHFGLEGDHLREVGPEHGRIGIDLLPRLLLFGRRFLAGIAEPFHFVVPQSPADSH